MTLPFRFTVESDCSILMMRALFKQQVVAFGEDGLGKHGTCDRPQYYEIEDISIDLENDITFDEDAKGTVHLKLKGYSAKDFGHIATDKNFMISLANHLKDAEIDPSCVSYAPIGQQTDDGVMLTLKVAILLNWI